MVVFEGSKSLLMKSPLFFATLALCAVAGCSSNTTTLVPVSNSAVGATSTTPNSAPETSGSQGIPDSGSPVASSNGQPQVPPGMSMGTSTALTPTPQLDAKIAQLSKGNNKKALAAAYADRGTERMNDGPSLPRVKYRAALADYRQALKLDPTNVQAQTNKKQIEDIYRSMGRPIPQ